MFVLYQKGAEMQTYSSVEEYFQAVAPELVSLLNNTGAFWPAVRDNTITNDALRRAQHFVGQASSTARAAQLLSDARQDGRLSNPG